jgi:hypothetical protein
MNDYENLWEEFDREIDQTFQECERDKREFFSDLYVDFQRDGIEYLNRKNNNSAICLMYEAFIYFLLQEDYKKCGYIRSLLNSYSNYRFQKYTSLRKRMG